nr:MAG TPA: hypothetical protein [Caudoviricetes sp.]
MKLKLKIERKALKYLQVKKEICIFAMSLRDT